MRSSTLLGSTKIEPSVDGSFFVYILASHPHNRYANHSLSRQPLYDPPISSMWIFLLSVVGIILACYALMIVCDRYFVQSLDVISQKRKLSDDIAGATIMAVGSSAPELFTALMALLNGGKI